MDAYQHQVRVAPVESEFNKLKNLIVHNSLRVDKFWEEHIKYLIGRVIIADANISRKQIDVSTSNQSPTYSDHDYNVNEFQDNLDFVHKNMNLSQNTILNLNKLEENAKNIFSSLQSNSDSDNHKQNIPQILNESFNKIDIKNKATFDLSNTELPINDHNLKSNQLKEIHEFDFDKCKCLTFAFVEIKFMYF